MSGTRRVVHDGVRSRRGRLAAIAVVALLAAGCSQGVGAPGGRSTNASERSSPTAPTESTRIAEEAVIPHCETVPRISAPADRYRDSPIYVANEMPVERIRAWAAGKPGFEELWIDREHGGWITLAFSVEDDARQAELEERFPDVGVVAVGVDWTMSELQALQARVGEELSPRFPVATGISVTRGVVTIGVGVLSAERLGAIEERLAGERVCVEGSDPADMPAAGPQPQQGDGWRLLADEKGAGEAYRTGIASDQASYERLWSDIGLSGDPPAADFRSEVVIWFGAVYGSSCPSLRLDDVVVDRDRSLVHALIVLVDPPPACTADANPHAYVVAVGRAKLPRGPFAIQLGPEDPPAGVPEERTVVDADLSRPGAVARPDDVHPDPALPKPDVLEPGSIIEPGYPQAYRLYVHCGIEWLGRFNDVAWRTDVPDRSIDFIPPEWEPTVDRRQMLELSITLRTDPEPTIAATANGHTVTYHPTLEEMPICR